MRTSIQTFLCFVLLMSLGLSASGQTVVAARLIRSKSIITPSDLTVLEMSTDGTLRQISGAVGMEARNVLYPGRPVLPSDIGPAAVIERNQIISLVYKKGALRISVDGRALARGGVGERIRVINTESRTTVSGLIIGPGIVEVSP